MKTLVMGAAYGYKVEDLKPFVLSLRRHYSGDVLFITGRLDAQSQHFFNSNNIFTYELEHVYHNPREIQLDRYIMYREILEENFEDVERILLTDVRDVMFQANPFGHEVKAQLEFFHEPATYTKCKCNGNWISTVFGPETLEELADKLVICSGTTIGTQAGIMEYINTMIEETDKVKAKNIPLFNGIDQPIHAHAIYKGLFKDYIMYHNGQGPITTVHHQIILRVDRMGQLLNDDNTVTPIIHQWDRADRVKPVLEKTALEGPGPVPDV